MEVRAKGRRPGRVDYRYKVLGVSPGGLGRGQREALLRFCLGVITGAAGLALLLAALRWR